MKTTEIKQKKFFYGYWVLLVAFFCVFISFGVGTYSFSLFITSLESDLGWGRGAGLTGLPRRRHEPRLPRKPHRRVHDGERVADIQPGPGRSLRDVIPANQHQAWH